MQTMVRAIFFPLLAWGFWTGVSRAVENPDGGDCRREARESGLEALAEEAGRHLLILNWKLGHDEHGSALSLARLYPELRGEDLADAFGYAAARTVGKRVVGEALFDTEAKKWILQALHIGDRTEGAGPARVLLDDLPLAARWDLFFAFALDPKGEVRFQARGTQEDLQADCGFMAETLFVALASGFVRKQGIGPAHANAMVVALGAFVEAHPELVTKEQWDLLDVENGRPVSLFTYLNLVWKLRGYAALFPRAQRPQNMVLKGVEKFLASVTPAEGQRRPPQEQLEAAAREFVLGLDKQFPGAPRP